MCACLLVVIKERNKKKKEKGPERRQRVKGAQQN